MRNDDYRHYAIVVKPIGAACNLRCNYCYYLDKAQLCHPKLMSDELLEHYVRQVIEIHGRYAEIEFAWHGGEPLMCGLDFFRRAISQQKKYGRGRKILNTLQTNGTLLHDEWCRFFKENSFQIGISIDGPEELHNTYRKNADGQGTFAMVMRGIELLRKFNVAFNTLTTVNATNCTQGRLVYRFLRDISDYMQFLPVVECCGEGGVINIPPGAYTAEMHCGSQVASFSVSSVGYGDFLCDVFDEWKRKDVGNKFVQIFEATLGNMLRKPAGLCVHESVCGHCGVVECNGDLYRCDRYVFPEYRIGNISESNLALMMDSNQEFGEYKLENLPSRCLHCEVVDLCFGGCPKDRIVSQLSLNGVLHHNYLCPSYKNFFTYFRKHISELFQSQQHSS